MNLEPLHIKTWILQQSSSCGFNDMRAYELYKKFSIAELVAMEKAVCNEPKNQLPKGGLNLYTKSALRKLKDIRFAITYHLSDHEKT